MKYIALLRGVNISIKDKITIRTANTMKKYQKYVKKRVAYEQI